MGELFMIQRFIKLILFLLVATNCWATDYYISTTGNDSDAGTVGAPFLTPQKCADVAVNPGDTCYFNDGTYTTGFTLTEYSGSAETPKNIEGITNANPAVVTVTGHGYSNGDLVAFTGLTDYLTTGMLHLQDHWYVIANAATDTFELNLIGGGNVDSTNFDPWVAGGTVRRIHPISFKAINRDAVIIDKSVTISGWSGSGLPANTYLSSAVGSTVSNIWKVGVTTPLTKKTSAAAVTSEGSWYYDSATDKVTIYTTSNPTLFTYKSGNGAYSIKGVSYILVDGIVAQYGGVLVGIGYYSGFPTDPAQLLEPGTSDIFLNHVTAQYGGGLGCVAIQTASTNPTTRVTFDYSTVAYCNDSTATGGNGHCFKFAANQNEDDGSYTTFSNGTVHDCVGHGIQTSNAWTHSSIFGSRVYNVALGAQAATVRCGWTGIVGADTDCKVFDNNLGGSDLAGTTSKVNQSGVYIQDEAQYAKIFRNRIHHNGFHGIYIFYTSGTYAPRNVLIFNNLIYNNGTAGIAGDSCHSVSIYNNSLYYNGEAATLGNGAGLRLKQNTCIGIAFRNNIVANATADSIYTKSYYQLTSDYNDLYTASGFSVTWNSVRYTSLVAYTEAATALSGPWDANSVTEDPLFASPSTGDFRIPSPTTPADSSGTNLISTIPKDYAQEDRQVPFDMGAYNTQGNLLVLPSVVLSSDFPARSGNVTVSFYTTGLDVENNWKIVFTLPSGFQLNQGGSTAVSSLVGIDGTVTLSSVGQIITLTRNADGTTTTPTLMGFTLSNIRNPSIAGVTGVYKIRIDDEVDAIQGESNDIPGSLISDVSPKSLTGLTINGAMLRP